MMARKDVWTMRGSPYKNDQYTLQIDMMSIDYVFMSSVKTREEAELLSAMEVIDVLNGAHQYE